MSKTLAPLVKLDTANIYWTNAQKIPIVNHTLFQNKTGMPHVYCAELVNIVIRNIKGNKMNI